MSNLGNRANALGAGTRARQGHRQPAEAISEPVVAVVDKKAAIVPTVTIKAKKPALTKYGTKAKNRARKGK